MLGESNQEDWWKWWAELKGITPICWQHKWWKRQCKKQHKRCKNLRMKRSSPLFTGPCKELTEMRDGSYSYELQNTTQESKLIAATSVFLPPFFTLRFLPILPFAVSSEGILRPLDIPAANAVWTLHKEQMQFRGLLGCIIIHLLSLCCCCHSIGKWGSICSVSCVNVNALQKCVCNKYFIHIHDIFVSRDLVLIIATGIHESANDSHCIFTPRIHAQWQQKQ